MINLGHIDDGNGFDFNNISDDYARYRDIYPTLFYQRIIDLGLCGAGKTVLDLGTGTGVLPRHLQATGAKFVGLDISEKQIENARKLSAGMDIDYIVSPAETIDFPDATFDTALACMCFTYFDKSVLLPRLARMLKADGRFAIMSLVWLPAESAIASRSEELVLKYNPAWNGAGYRRPDFDEYGIPTTYKGDIRKWYEVDTSFAFDVSVPFTREGWQGRMKATRGLASSSLTQEQIQAFEKEHWRDLQGLPESFEIPHSATFCVLKKRA